MHSSADLLANLPPRPLNTLRLRPRDHMAALWWIFWLYRCPTSWHSTVEAMTLPRSLLARVVLFLHALPWIFLAATAGHMLIGELLAATSPLPGEPFPAKTLEYTKESLLVLLSAFSFGLAFALVVGLWFGFLFSACLYLVRLVTSLWRTIRKRHVPMTNEMTFGRAYLNGFKGGFNFIFGLLLITVFGGTIGYEEEGMTLTFVQGHAGSFLTMKSLLNLFLIGMLTGLVFSCARSLWPPTIIAGLVCSLLLVASWIYAEEDMLFTGIAYFLGFFVGLPRLYYFPWHCILLFAPTQRPVIQFHPAAWDWRCACQFPGMDRLLRRHVVHSPSTSSAEVSRIVSPNPVPRRLMERMKATVVTHELQAAFAASGPANYVKDGPGMGEQHRSTGTATSCLGTQVGFQSAADGVGAGCDSENSAATRKMKSLDWIHSGLAAVTAALSTAPPSEWADSKRVVLVAASTFLLGAWQTRRAQSVTRSASHDEVIAEIRACVADLQKQLTDTRIRDEVLRESVRQALEVELVKQALAIEESQGEIQRLSQCIGSIIERVAQVEEFVHSSANPDASLVCLVEVSLNALSLPEQNHIHSVLDQRFTKEQLSVVSERCGVDWDNLAGDTKSKKAMELIRECRSSGCFAGLIREVERQRPGSLKLAPGIV